MKLFFYRLIFKSMIFIRGKFIILDLFEGNTIYFFFQSFYLFIFFFNFIIEHFFSLNFYVKFGANSFSCYFLIIFLIDLFFQFYP
jgi:hypothetical protein